MGKSEYYFVLKSEIEDFFPCRIIKQHNNSCLEIENLETGAKENLIDGRHYKTEIDVRLEKRAQQINSFIERKGVVLYTFNLILVDGLKETHKIFTFLARKDELEKIVKALEGIKEKSEFYNYLKTLNCVITIEDLFEVLKEKYNIILSSEEKKNIILKLDKPREDN